MDTCVFTGCPRLVAPNSRVACREHLIEVERVEAALLRRTRHVCAVHPERPAELFDHDDEGEGDE